MVEAIRDGLEGSAREFRYFDAWQRREMGKEIEEHGWLHDLHVAVVWLMKKN